ncbi:hypothetical protein BT69DRAFT_1332735 [Atractiella rhizophila]|nr:hypothetical protein BT69DRAFT_1332735 [Atractiella rhizophila]
MALVIEPALRRKGREILHADDLFKILGLGNDFYHLQHDEPKPLLRRLPQTSPIALLPNELLFQIFHFSVPQVSIVEDLNQDFITRFCRFRRISVVFSKVALSAIRDYSNSFANHFSAYALNIGYLRNMAVEYGFMWWRKDEWLNLGLPHPPSSGSWLDLLRAVATHPGDTKVQIFNLPWDGFDLEDTLISISTDGLASLRLHFRNQQAALSLQHILLILSQKIQDKMICGLIPSPPQARWFFPSPSESLALLRCHLSDEDVDGFGVSTTLFNTELPYARTLRFSSFHPSLTAAGFRHLLRNIGPHHLCCAFQKLFDSDESEEVLGLAKHLDEDLLLMLSYRLNGTLYLDGGVEHSRLISDRFLGVKADWHHLSELVLLYCHLPASSILEFLQAVTQIQGYWLSEGLIVQLKPFFGDCDFSTSWFCEALGTFQTSLRISSVQSFNERYGEKSVYPLQYDPWSSGTVFCAFCAGGGQSVDLWIIDQDDALGNGDSLFFWENFDTNRNLRSMRRRSLSIAGL